MQRFVIVLSLLINACGSGTAVEPSAAPPTPPKSDSPASSSELAALLQSMIDARWGLTEAAIPHAEVIAQQHFADDHVSIYENGDQRTKADIVLRSAPERVKQFRASALSTGMTATVEDVSARAWGETAVVHYRIKMQLVLNDEGVIKIFRCSEVFRRFEDRWQSVLHTETATPTRPVAAHVNTRLYDHYVGRYRLLPDVVFTITREGERLFSGARKKLELIPETENTFLVERDPDRRVHSDTGYTFIFLRDATGRVSHLRIREFPGVSYSAVKIE